MAKNPYRDRAPSAIFEDAHFTYLKTLFSDFFEKRIRPRDTVLELGAGTAKLSMHVAAHMVDTQLTAMDIDPAALDYQIKVLRAFEGASGHRILNLNLKQGDLFNSGFPRESFEVVFSEGVVEHWTDEKRQKCIDVHADLAKRCVLIITTNGDNPEATAKATSTEQEYVGMEPYEGPYTKDELKEKMVDSGLTKVCVWRSGELYPENDDYLLAEGFK